MTNHEALELLGKVKYVELTTYRKDGEGVPTPIWIVQDGDKLVAITVEGLGKVKRLRRDPRVALRPCNVRGKVEPDAPTVTGTAVVLRGDADVRRVRRALNRKYLLARVGDLISSVIARVRPNRPARVGLEITLD